MAPHGARRFYRRCSEDPDEDGQPGIFAIESHTAEVFVELHETQCGAEGASSGDYDIYSGEILHADDYAGRHPEYASDPEPGVGGGYFSNRQAVLGESAGKLAERVFTNFAPQCTADGVS